MSSRSSGLHSLMSAKAKARSLWEKLREHIHEQDFVNSEQEQEFFATLDRIYVRCIDHTRALYLSMWCGLRCAGHVLR